MSTIEQRELQSNNGWQNIGICVKFARENIDNILFSTYIFLVEESFGYCKHTTKRISLTEISKKLKVSRNKVIRNIDELIKLNFVTRYDSNKYLVNGGSEAFCYAPILPKGYGFINTSKDSTESGSEVKKETSNTTIEQESKTEWNKEKNIDF